MREKTALDSVHDLVDGASKLVIAEAPPWLRRTTLDWSVPETGRPTLKLFSVQPLVGGGIAGRALLFQGHALSKEANTRGHLGLRSLMAIVGASAPICSTTTNDRAPRSTSA